jgi:peptidoglycan/xylan/chitin deacetylase (PgdA/CDA1 family)
MIKQIAPWALLLAAAALGSCASTAGNAQNTRAARRAVETIKANPQNITKYTVLDENRSPAVKALLRGPEGFAAAYEVTYEVAAASDSNSNGAFQIPFVMKDLAAGIEYRDTLAWKAEPDGTGILLAFDDDYSEVWADYFDLFDQYGAKVTFFVQGLPLDFCAQALARGHDVGYHTRNHLNLTKVSQDVFFEETCAQAEAFREQGIPLASFAYPFGLSEAWMHRELLRCFTSLRGYGVTFRLYHRDAAKKGYISSKALDNILFKEERAFEKEALAVLLAAAFVGRGHVLPLTTHTIADAADWGIKPSRLEYLLKTAARLGLRFYRYCDMQGP